jgi:hypothetical protein
MMDLETKEGAIDTSDHCWPVMEIELVDVRLIGGDAKF